MNSGELIVRYVFFGIGIFVLWELLQLLRRRMGNDSARTFTQVVMKKARAGDRRYKALILIFPGFWITVGVWLWFHFEVWDVVIKGRKR